jgi:hypothetical protein
MDEHYSLYSRVASKEEESSITLKSIVTVISLFIANEAKK